jgi:hypothetical protein
MFGLFKRNPELVQEDTPDRLVLATPDRSVTFDLPQQQVFLATNRWIFSRKTQTFSFKEIVKIYLDYSQEVYSIVPDHYGGAEERIRHTWTIFLLVQNSHSLTVAQATTDHPAEQTVLVATQLAYWENLAAKICTLTSKRLARTATVPGPPHTFVEEIDQIIQDHLRQSSISGRVIHLCTQMDGGLKIVIDGKIYQNFSEITEVTIRDLIQAAVDEWQSGKR